MQKFIHGTKRLLWWTRPDRELFFLTRSDLNNQVLQQGTHLQTELCCPEQQSQKVMSEIDLKVD
ncbi:MAG: hypothetical protein QGH37_18620 [Candidatus Poribacteria bacterium]|nr:hypothetical protein [Candidatus Poribacteria bacterium]